jgi:hypothetical protein
MEFVKFLQMPPLKRGGIFVLTSVTRLAPTPTPRVRDLQYASKVPIPITMTTPIPTPMRLGSIIAGQIKIV